MPLEVNISIYYDTILAVKSQLCTVKLFAVNIIKLLQYYIKRSSIMTLREAISERIFSLCHERGITVNKLSTISGMTQSTINNIINTGSNNPTVSTIKKICDGLDISLAEFFDNELFTSLEQEIKQPPCCFVSVMTVVDNVTDNIIHMCEYTLLQYCRADKMRGTFIFTFS